MTQDAFIEKHLAESVEIIQKLDRAAIASLIKELVELRARGGRLFLLGVGGSAGSASHAVNDFRKLCNIETYTPVDNVSELTARTNDEGWATTFSAWLKVSRLGPKDAIFILSVGGGNLEKNVSPNLVSAIQVAQEVGARVLGIVGRDGGFTKQSAHACVVIPTVNPEATTPHTEAFHVVVWHLVISHPALKAAATKWESVSR